MYQSKLTAMSFVAAMSVLVACAPTSISVEPEQVVASAKSSGIAPNRPI